MKKTILTTALAMLLATPLFASVYVGYTNENLNKSQKIRLTTNTDQRIAVRLSAEKLAVLKGKTISGIRAAFGSKQTTGNKATLFITTSLDGDAVASQDVTISGSQKFADYTLDTPYTITGNETELYIGYMMSISPSYGAFSMDESNDMSGIAFAYGKNGWEDLSGKGYGMPNIEIITDDINFTDLVIKPHSEDGFIKVDKAFSTSYEVFNFGTTDINSFDVAVRIGNEEKTYSFNETISPHASYTMSLSDIVAKESGNSAFSVSVTNINGADDADISDNQSALSVYIYPADCQKSILVETFTSQSCTNCPTGHSSIASAISQAGVPVVEISHHSGYQSDIFTMDEDWDITGFYNGSTYAPAAMFNRTVFDTTFSNPSPVYDDQSISSDKNRLLTLNEEKPYVSINLNTNYDSSAHQVTLNADVYTCEEMPGKDLRYSIWLVQDSIVASQSNGGTNYVHRFVSRGALTESSFGDAATFVPGETLSIEKLFELTDTIVSTKPKKDDETCHIPVDLKNMKIVFFVNQYSSSDLTQCRVFNAAECSVGQSVDGIADLNLDANPNENSARKCIKNGRLVIIKNNQTFRLDGVKL